MDGKTGLGAYEVEPEGLVCYPDADGAQPLIGKNAFFLCESIVFATKVKRFPQKGLG